MIETEARLALSDICCDDRLSQHYGIRGGIHSIGTIADI
jgi:hypothetical protein